MNSGAGRASRKGSVGSASASGGGGSEVQTVGALLAAIATCMAEALRIFMFADKRQWGPDEFEQTRALEAALDEAKKDFQEMAPLVHGQFYYENDRTPESLSSLTTLLAKFQFHTQNFKDWARQGGPINPTWARETTQLSRALHRAQCRAASRIFAAEQEGTRCLGAFQVYREQQRRRLRSRGRERSRERQGGSRSLGEASAGEGEGGSGGGGAPASWQRELGGQGQVGEEGRGAEGSPPPEDGAGERDGEGQGERRGSLEALVPSCNAVGRFQLLRGEADSPLQDAAFVCDFCEGYIVWPDLSGMPSERTPLPPTAVTGYPHWQAKGASAETGEEKTVVFAPLAIANHMPPEPGDWQAGLMCPYCDEDTYVDEGEDSSELKYVQDEGGFPDLETFRQHLEWYHTALPVPPISSLAAALPSTASNCRVM